MDAEKKEPQINTSRVTPLEGVPTSTVAPVDVAHPYGSPPYVDISPQCAPQGIFVRKVVNQQDFGIDERRFNASYQEKSNLFCGLKIDSPPANGAKIAKHSLIFSLTFVLIIKKIYD